MMCHTDDEFGWTCQMKRFLRMWYYFCCAFLMSCLGKNLWVSSPAFVLSLNGQVLNIEKLSCFSGWRLNTVFNELLSGQTKARTSPSIMISWMTFGTRPFCFGGYVPKQECVISTWWFDITCVSTSPHWMLVICRVAGNGHPISIIFSMRLSWIAGDIVPFQKPESSWQGSWRVVTPFHFLCVNALINLWRVHMSFRYWLIRISQSLSSSPSCWINHRAVLPALTLCLLSDINRMLMAVC